jgi:peptide/nickel transport system permease protein
MKKQKHLNRYICLFLLSAIVLFAVLGTWLAPYNPLTFSLSDELCQPSRMHFFGCDGFGADVFSIILHGAKLSLLIGTCVTLVNLAIGLLVGSLAGYFGGWLDLLLMRVLDIFLAFPGLILSIAIASILGPSKYNLILALIITGWAGYAKLVRGEILALKEKQFIEAAHALGLSQTKIIFFHLWPNLVPSLTVAASFGIAHTIVAEASLSFLGVGVPPGTPSWGALLSAGKDLLIEAPHVALFPALCLLFVVLTFNYAGEVLRAYLDPRN